MLNSELIKQLVGGPSDFGIGWWIILVSSIATVLVFVFDSLRWLIDKIQEKDRLLEKISILDTGSHISHFITLLGNYVTANRFSNYKEYIFTNHYFYVQAVTDSEENVSMFSVTTRRKNFHPILKTQFNDLIVELGKMNFSQLGGSRKDSNDRSDHGAVVAYSESYYFGLDGSYRTYFFSFNPNGYGRISFLPQSNPESDLQVVDRKRTVVNTYTVSRFSGPDGYKEFNKEMGSNIVLGPGRGHIRVFANK